MNVFMNKQQSLYQLDIKEQNRVRTTFGDMLAVSLVSFYTVSALLVSSWSAIILMTGKNADNSPIGYLISLLQSSGII